MKLDFDMYHLQLSEGNLINNLKLQSVRLDPRTNQRTTPIILRTLLEAGYAAYVDMEMAQLSRRSMTSRWSEKLSSEKLGTLEGRAYGRSDCYG